MRVGRAAWVSLLAAIFLTILVAAEAEAQTGAGYRGFSFAASGVETPTRDKPQSKLWFNDGSWWGALFDRSTEQYTIHRYDLATHSWVDTGVLIDERNNSLSDALWDGEHLYVASAGPDRRKSADSGRFLRYSYDATNKRYTQDSGFPQQVTEFGMEAIVLERDTTGQFWITYTRDNSVLVNRSQDTTGGDWGQPFVLPVAGADNATFDDISAVVAFDSQIGIMWSNQNEDAMYFATHDDGAPDDAWRLQTANRGPGIADDHINLKSLHSDASGRVFAAVKTSLDKTGNSNAPQILLMERDLNGSWTNHVFGRVRDGHTRPVVMIDEENNDLYMLATAPTGGGTIYYKSTPLSNISFQDGRGDPFIQSSTDPRVNDATSTKQNLTSKTGFLALAADDTTDYYLHNYVGLRQSADITPPDTSIDSGPSSVLDSDAAIFTFTSSEDGSTFECALDGEAFTDCASPKEYEGLEDGEHAFRVRATDPAGNTDPTPASISWTVDTTSADDGAEAPVVEPPEQNFFRNSPLTNEVHVPVSWSATDPDGIVGYELQRSVNGRAYNNMNLASETATGKYLILSVGATYQFRVRATDGLGNVSEWAYGPEFTVAAPQQETSGAVSYGGAWTEEASPSASGGGLKHARDAGAVAKFTFTGRNVAWVAPMSVDRGVAEVWLDGRKVETISLYRASGQSARLAFTASWPTPGTHELEIRVLGDKVSRSSDTRVDVDAFVVLN